MSTSQATMDFLLDQLSEAGPVSSRKMFGEYCLYYAGRPVGLVCDEQLFLKPTPEGRALIRELTEGAPFPGARPHFLIPADLWDDRQWLGHLVRETALALPPPKPAKPKTTKPKTAKPAGSNTPPRRRT